VDWIDLAQDRARGVLLWDVVMDDRFPLNAGNFLTSRGTKLSRRTMLYGISKDTRNIRGFRHI
jgi:hypothetical protein